MAPRKQHSEAEVVHLLKLNNDYKIHFRPPTTLTDWDRDGLPCRDLFEQLLQIRDIKFASYPAHAHQDGERAHRTKLFVRKIQSNAARCKKERDNEAGWINNVASLVFERLDGFEFRCQGCRQYLWLPDFVALPKDPVEASHLRERHARRSLCSCTAAERSDIVQVDPLRPSIFSNKSDERVMHGDHGMKHEVVDQKYKRPDRVYGLSATSSFAPFRDHLDEFSPFKGGHTLFPFLLVEAKSEKSASGFAQIERQTALSIRTCLRLQIDLETKSSQVLDPLVWFFGFMGDEWRLYMAFMVGDETKVVDCWHGYIQDPDQALQLLLIVDWICGWAKDVHREGVVRCLTGLTAREMTPAGTLFSSQGDRTRDDQPARSNSLAFRPSRPPPTARDLSPRPPLVHDIIPIVDSEDEVMGDDAPTNVSEISENMDQPDVNNTDQQRVVRSARSTVYRWNHLDIPSEESILLEILGDYSSPDSLQSAASYLWHIITDENHSSKISLRAVSELLHNSSENDMSDFAREEPMATLVVCQRRLVETSWQVICNFWCITCSQEAARLLAIIGGVTESQRFGLAYWRAHDCDCLIPLVKSMGNLEGKASAAAAISQETCCVVPSETNFGHLEWKRTDASVFQPRLVVLEGLFKYTEGTRHTNLPVAVSRATSDSSLNSGLFDIGGLEGLHGVLLKRPTPWPPSCPRWCFMTFDTAHRENIGMQIAAAHAGKAVYTSEGWESDDDDFILRWARES